MGVTSQSEGELNHASYCTACRPELHYVIYLKTVRSLVTDTVLANKLEDLFFKPLSANQKHISSTITVPLIVDNNQRLRTFSSYVTLRVGSSNFMQLCSRLQVMSTVRNLTSSDYRFTAL